ncbi:MAG: DNA polymerase III subunit epsilon [Chitinophaga sp.]|jgi:DNA polymerase III subunit epsilon|nr:DNA polymerase III subunit epsilon [Chitinophaga sp.]
MFAIVDIETSGGHALGHGITEIGIVLHNGKEVEGKYSTLINPKVPIQKYVQGLTGITDAMVANAPAFEDVAPNIYNLLKDRVFVAHNVNFDYSFVKHQFYNAGYDFNTRKLCTIRLTRKIFPTLPKYGLQTVCRELKIINHSPHRAIGDAMATAQLFSLLLANDKSGELKKMMKGRNAEQYIPPNVDVRKIHALPSLPGVYYFLNEKEKVIYVGKAKNLKKRVTSHFANNKPSQQKQEFLRNIYDIKHTACSSELTAAIFESIEIKRLWPKYNKSQKHFELKYGIYQFEDVKGYQRLAIDKKHKYSKPLLSFSLMADAHRTLWKLVKDYELNPSLCFLDKTDKVINNLPEVEIYNQSVSNALQSAQSTLETYLLHDGAANYILMEEGKFYGMGVIKDESKINNISEVKNLLTQYPENEVLRAMIQSYAVKYPSRVIAL